MNKKGFVFLETLVVIVVLSVSILGIFTIYNTVNSNIDERKYYDSIGDIYKAYVIKDMVNLNNLTSEDVIKITKDNCTSYLSNNCINVIGTLEIDSIYINNISIEKLINGTNQYVPNSLKLYMKTIYDNNDNNKYIIVSFNKLNNKYYSSLPLYKEGKDE